MGAVSIRASAGASEFVQALVVDNPELFISESQANGWKFFAAVPPTQSADPIMLADMLTSPLTKDPCVLILGNEEKGLPPWLTRLTDHRVAVGGCSPAAVNAGLDSLNVSVAATILCERFLRRPTTREIEAEAQAEKEKIF